MINSRVYEKLYSAQNLLLKNNGFLDLNQNPLKLFTDTRIPIQYHTKIIMDPHSWGKQNDK